MWEAPNQRSRRLRCLFHKFATSSSGMRQVRYEVWTYNDSGDSVTKRRFGALRKLPSGRWQVRYRDPEGRLVTGPATFANKTDAARYLDSVELDQLRGVWHDPAPGQREVLRDWANRWFDQHAPTLTPSSAASYRGLLDVCVIDHCVRGREVGLGDLSLANVTPMRVGE